MRKLSWMLLLSIILVTIPLQAEKWALLIGINNYPNDISNLKYCVSDVEAFGQALIEVVGYKSDQVILMTDQMTGSNQPSNLNVIKKIDRLSKQVKSGDTFILYFSGHGISKDGQSFLLATNSDSDSIDTLEMSAIPLKKVSDILSRIKARQLLTIIDACRNDPTSARGDDDNLLTREFAKDLKIKRGMKIVNEPKISATLFACSLGQRAYEWAEVKQGVFSHYLLQGLKGEVINNQGEVTIADLADYTREKMSQWTKANGKKTQTPWLSSEGGGNLVLATKVVPQPDPIPANIETVITTTTADPETEAWEVVKDSTDPLDIQDFLAVFPHGKLAAAARLKMTRLERASKPTVTPPQAEHQPEKSIISPKDGAKMVLIPTGPSTNAFYMDVYEVTNAQYGKFMRARGYSEPVYWNDSECNQPNQPVVGISWHDATAYAKWAGKRLPTEKEWEQAARGGLKNKTYPWGDNESFARDHANYKGTGGKDKWEYCAPVASFKPNGYGLFDMAGNVDEWCQDWDDNSDRDTKVLRGGAWHNNTYGQRVAARGHFDPNHRFGAVGFRCVSGFDNPYRF